MGILTDKVGTEKREWSQELEDDACSALDSFFTVTDAEDRCFVVFSIENREDGVAASVSVLGSEAWDKSDKSKLGMAKAMAGVPLSTFIGYITKRWLNKSAEDIIDESMMAQLGAKAAAMLNSEDKIEQAIKDGKDALED